jgi:hypothetical protein
LGPLVQREWASLRIASRLQPSPMPFIMLLVYDSMKFRSTSDRFSIGWRRVEDKQLVEKVNFLRLFKNAQMQGSRNPEE